MTLSIIFDLYNERLSALQDLIKAIKNGKQIILEDEKRLEEAEIAFNKALNEYDRTHPEIKT